MIREGDIITVEGGITLYKTIPTVILVISIKDASDDSLVETLKTWIGTLEASTEKTYQEMNSGAPLIWDTTGYTGEYYVLVEIYSPSSYIEKEYFYINSIVPILAEIEVNTDKSAYKVGDTITVTGLLKSTEQVYGCNVKVEVRKKSDDSLIETLLNATSDLPKDVEVTLDDIMGGVIHWDT